MLIRRLGGFETIDVILTLAFSPSYTREDEKTRFEIPLSLLLVPEKSRRRDLESRFLTFSYPTSREDEIRNLAFSPSHTREDGKTRFGISLSHLLLPEKSRRRGLESRFLTFTYPRSGEDEI